MRGEEDNNVKMRDPRSADRDYGYGNEVGAWDKREGRYIKLDPGPASSQGDGYAEPPTAREQEYLPLKDVLAREQAEKLRKFFDITHTSKAGPKMQAFTTGATRGDDSNKVDFEGFFSPLVIDAYARYMHEHRIQDDGRARASDNWQKGIPFHKYMKSLFRHFMQLWALHRGYTPEPETRAGVVVPVTVTSALAGILFNTMGYFHEYLMDREAWDERVISEPEGGDVLRAQDVRRQYKEVA